jgi:hypothetical protein
MEISLVVIIGLVIVLIILALATAAIATSYSQLFSQSELLRSKNKKYKNELGRDSQTLEEERLVLKEKLNQVAVRDAEEFKKMLAEMKSASMNLFTNIAESARVEMSGDISKFSEELAKKVEEHINATETELASYKEARRKDIDARATEVLKEVAREVLPQSINFENKSELILSALKKAKEEHFFDN